MTCSDCIHDEVCEKREKLCENFKNKANFIEVHCKREDTVYFIKTPFGMAKVPIKAKVTYIKKVNEDGTVIYKALTDVGIDRSFISSEIGKTIFFSEEAANKALEEEVKKAFEEAEFMQQKKGE